VRRFLDQDRGDDKDLGGEGDEAGPCSFNKTHGSFLLIRSITRSRGEMGGGAAFLNCKGRQA
jgi:hypothetical protein